MFDLKIPLTSDTLNAIKRDLTKSLPNVKSSHRVEAAARGMGFKGHASFLNAVRTGNHISRAVDGRAFSTYLAAHGFVATPKHFYRAAARVAIHYAMIRHPRLTHWGYNVGRPKKLSNGKWETAHEYEARFATERNALLTDRAAEEFLRSLVLVQRLKQIKTINTRDGSYGLKHIAENIECTYPDGAALGPAYVANGAFIVAAVHTGFDYRMHLDDLGYEGVNVTFNMSRISIDDALFQLGLLKLYEARYIRAERRVRPTELPVIPDATQHPL